MSNFADKIKTLFGMRHDRGADFFEELTDILIEGDIGAKTAFEIADELEAECKKGRIYDEKKIIPVLHQKLLSYIKQTELAPEQGKISIYMLLGVNGAGKTTTAAKLAAFYQKQGIEHIALAAADTFRAAAIEQLQMHGSRLGVRVVAHQHGADPSSVVFDAAAAIASKGSGLVIADTAGRLHNKENLVRELQKICRVAEQKASDGCCKKILVLDATTGQNALRQAEVFHEAVGVDAAVITKCDSTAKGGAAVQLGRELGIPLAFICSGEKYDDIALFNPDSFVRSFTGNPE